jgi:hypothetical protein
VLHSCSVLAVLDGQIDLQLTEEGWWRATGAVPQPLLIRFEYVVDRLQVTGLRLESGGPITAAVLRSIPIGELKEAYLPHLREQFSEVRKQVLDGYDVAGQQRFTELLEPILHIATSGEAAVLTPRSRGAKSPTAAEYRAFAAMYAEELTRGERGAVSRTARRWGVHRSTALRWRNEMPKDLQDGGEDDQT